MITVRIGPARFVVDEPESHSRLVIEPANFLDRQQMGIRPRVVLEPLRRRLAPLADGADRIVDLPVMKADGRLDHEMPLELEREVGVVRRAHYLVELLSRPDADDPRGQVSYVIEVLPRLMCGER